MEYRILTPDEVSNLPAEFYADVDKLGLGEKYDGNSGVFVGAFDKDALVGVWAATLQVHTGPLWVAPTHRGDSAIRDGMWTQLCGVVRDLGATHTLMFAMDDTPQVARIIAKMPHREIHGRPFLMEVESCP